jgi:hypothetical protein
MRPHRPHRNGLGSFANLKPHDRMATSAIVVGLGPQVPETQFGFQMLSVCTVVGTKVRMLYAFPPSQRGLT